MSTKTFTLGQTVKWRSSAGGTWKEKQGEVVHVVKGKSHCPDKKWMESRYKASASPIDGGYRRDHESYIIKVPGTSEKARPRLYWPRVSALELVEEEKE